MTNRSTSKDSSRENSWRAIGEFIRTQRQLAHLSLRQLSDLAEVSNPYLSQIERGLHRPSAQVLYGVARALNVSAEQLYAKAGLLSEAALDNPVGVEEAIRLDDRLSSQQKQTLLDVYHGFVETSSH